MGMTKGTAIFAICLLIEDCLIKNSEVTKERYNSILSDIFYDDYELIPEYEEFGCITTNTVYYRYCRLSTDGLVEIRVWSNLVEGQVIKPYSTFYTKLNQEEYDLTLSYDLLKDISSSKETKNYILSVTSDIKWLLP